MTLSRKVQGLFSSSHLLGLLSLDPACNAHRFHRGDTLSVESGKQLPIRAAQRQPLCKNQGSACHSHHHQVRVPVPKLSLKPGCIFYALERHWVQPTSANLKSLPQRPWVRLSGCGCQIPLGYTLFSWLKEQARAWPPTPQPPRGHRSG